MIKLFHQTINSKLNYTLTLAFASVFLFFKLFFDYSDSI